MTQLSKASLQALFEQGDVPSGTDYANLIDSQINAVETSSQSMGGALITTELITPRVSAANGVFTGVVSARDVYADTIRASALNIPIVSVTTLSANNVYANNVIASAVSATGLHSVTATISALDVIGTVSAAGINVRNDVSAAGGTVYASAVRSTNGFIGSSGIVSAAGTTQGAAAVLTNVINRGKGIVDGTTTGFTPLANRAGLVQYLLNEGPSANLWPPTGGFINGLAVNTPFALAASAAFTIFHITASSYGVK